MFYSKSTGGFYDTAIHGDSIPVDAIEITPRSMLFCLKARAKENASSRTSTDFRFWLTTRHRQRLTSGNTSRLNAIGAKPADSKLAPCGFTATPTAASSTSA